MKEEGISVEHRVPAWNEYCMSCVNKIGELMNMKLIDKEKHLYRCEYCGKEKIIGINIENK